MMQAVAMETMQVIFRRFLAGALWQRGGCGPGSGAGPGWRAGL